MNLNHHPKLLLSRSQLDELLSKYCEILGIKYSTLHDDAFCISLNDSDGWIFLWYDYDENHLASFIKRIDCYFNW